MAPNQDQNSPYTQEQLNAYFSRISFPVAKYPTIAPDRARSQEGLAYLAALQKYQLASVPFENLALHYSPEKVVSIDKDDLFEKIVGRDRGRGGYCMENNSFFGWVLQSLGFEVVATGARVTVGDGMTGWLVLCSLDYSLSWFQFPSESLWGSSWGHFMVAWLRFIKGP